MIFCWLIFGHWIGDFLFQVSAMAIKKSYSVKWLLFHVVTYTAVIFLFSLLLFDLKTALYFTIFNGIAHGITDFITSKVGAKYVDKPRIFFPILGFDQMVHMLTLYISYLEIGNYVT